LQITKIILKFILILFVVEVTLFAQEKISYSIAYVGMSMDYREYNDKGVIQDSESSDYSDLSGVEFGYTFNLQNEAELDSNSISFDAMILDGSTHYIGALLKSQCDYYGCIEGTTSDTIYDINLDLTHKYKLTQESKIELSLGVGYRYWFRELSSYQAEGYEWFSLRPAISFSYAIQNLSIKPKFEYQYGIRPTMSATGINEDFKLGAANILEFSLPMEYAINESFSLYGAYMYQYQKIEKSNVIYDNNGDGYLEPDSTAKNQYIKFGVAFKY